MTEDLARQVDALRERLSDLQSQVLSAASHYEAAAEGYRDAIAQLARRFRAVEAALREGDVDLEHVLRTSIQKVGDARVRL